MNLFPIRRWMFNNYYSNLKSTAVLTLIFIIKIRLILKLFTFVV